MCRPLAFFAMMLLAATAFAQTRPQLTPVEATGVVTGHVFCSDTHQPARFAKVSLEAVHAMSSGASRSEPSAAFTSTGVTSVETALDGSFLMTKVKPGSYYVIVSKAGYVSPRAMFTQKEIDQPTPELRAIIDRALPRVDVDNGQTAHAEVLLERGGAISGTVSYDDGTPAGERGVSLLHKDAAGKWVPLNGGSFHNGGWASTDDRGHFRFSSLLPDEYMLETNLIFGSMRETTMAGPNNTQMVVNMMSYRSNLAFYGEGTPHQADAKPIKLLSGEELSGQDITLPIAKLHRLSGRVLAGASGHAVNAADVKLLTREDGKELTTGEIDREDGLFHFDFVPEGDYTLRVTNARDVAWETPKAAVGATASPFPAQQKERVLETFGSVDMPLLLRGDMLDVLATVPTDAANSAAAKDAR